MPHADEPKKAARRRRWFQFSLRWLLVLCLIVSLPLGYIGWRIHRGRRIQEVARQLNDRGFHLKGYGVDGVHCGARPPPSDDLLWIRGFGPRLFGELTLARPDTLAEVDLHGDPDVIWALVAELPDLEEFDLFTSSEKLLQSMNAVPTFHRLRKLKQLGLANRIDDQFLEEFQPPPSLRSLRLSNVDGSSGATWQRFFAKSHITDLHLDNPAKPKTMLAAAKSLRKLESIHVTHCTLDDEGLKTLFALEPSGSLMITRVRIPEGDDRARQRLAAAGLNLDDLHFRGSDWKQFREDHADALLGDNF